MEKNILGRDEDTRKFRKVGTRRYKKVHSRQRSRTFGRGGDGRVRE